MFSGRLRPLRNTARSRASGVHSFNSNGAFARHVLAVQLYSEGTDRNGCIIWVQVISSVIVLYSQRARGRGRTGLICSEDRLLENLHDGQRRLGMAEDGRLQVI